MGKTKNRSESFFVLTSTIKQKFPLYFLVDVELSLAINFSNWSMFFMGKSKWNWTIEIWLGNTILQFIHNLMGIFQGQWFILNLNLDNDEIWETKCIKNKKRKNLNEVSNVCLVYYFFFFCLIICTIIYIR